MDNNVYKKVGRKYKPIGLLVDDHYLGDGFWYVSHGKGTKSITNVNYMAELYHLPYKRGEVDFGESADLHYFTEELMDSQEWRELTSKPHSLMDVVTFVVGKCYEQGKQKKNK